jgi:hypothetical protein
MSIGRLAIIPKAPFKVCSQIYTRAWEKYISSRFGMAIRKLSVRLTLFMLEF